MTRGNRAFVGALARCLPLSVWLHHGDPTSCGGSNDGSHETGNGGGWGGFGRSAVLRVRPGCVRNAGVARHLLPRVLGRLPGHRSLDVPVGRDGVRRVAAPIRNLQFRRRGQAGALPVVVGSPASGGALFVASSGASACSLASCNRAPAPGSTTYAQVAPLAWRATTGTTSLFAASSGEQRISGGVPTRDANSSPPSTNSGGTDPAPDGDSDPGPADPPSDIAPPDDPPGDPPPLLPTPFLVQPPPQVTATPEPSTIGLVALGIGGLGAARRRRNRR